ncbi:RiPP maturation radical SAM C-methyltransferase [Desulfosoma sp.]
MPVRLILVSMPWALADRPSIQLGSLKAYVTRAFGSAVQAEAAHPYLDVERVLGRSLYRRLAERSWLGEAVYAALLYPERAAACAGLFSKYWPRSEGNPAFEEICRKIKDFHDNMPLWRDLEKAHLVGFSVCFAQLASSLFLARALKERFRGVRTVFGGSLVSGVLGKSLMEAFPWIDFIISGEGEKPLVNLVSRLFSLHGGSETDSMQGSRDSFQTVQRQEGRGVPKPEDEKRPTGPGALGTLRREGVRPWGPGIFFRREDNSVDGGGWSQITNLDGAPLPDYGDFFREAQNGGDGRTPIFTLPVESSRGCWWHTAREDRPHKRACRFCNLNVQWRGYRSKAPHRVAQELAALADEHKSLHFVFVDNALNPAAVTETTQAIQRSGKDFHLFGEVRLPLFRHEVRALRLAGFREIQAGIEALSDGLLRRMGKGTRVIHNVAWMRHCEEFGIENRSNLILEFPGSTPQDVNETLDVLRAVRVYRPLKGVRFWLGEGSPMALDPESYGLKGIGNHPHYAVLFPEEIFRRTRFMVKAFRGDRLRQRRLWQPVRDFLRGWHREDAVFRNRTGGEKPKLGYLDGGTFLLIRRRDRHGRVETTYRLSGPSREIYLSCLDAKPLDVLEKEHGRFSSEGLRRFLDDMVAKGLVFRHREWILSLAVEEGVKKFLA